MAPRNGPENVDARIKDSEHRRIANDTRLIERSGPGHDG